jgi:hypothetical protein
MAADRVVVIDEDLNPRLAVELAGRGIPAVSVVRDLDLGGRLDPDVLRTVFGRYDDAVLVTGDDGMPAEHAHLIHRLGATIATIAPCPSHEPDEDAWERDIVHRHVHAMQEQDAGSIRRYHPSAGVPWTPRRR